MKKLFIVLGVLVMIVVTIAFSRSPGKVYADTWTRYETSNGLPLNTTDFLFTPQAQWYVSATVQFSGGYTAFTNTPNANISFNFTGTQFRIIALSSGGRSNINEINIDGISYTFSEYSTTEQYQCVVFDSINYVTLASGQHHVIITNKTSASLGVDAIDVLGTLNDPTINPTPPPGPTPTPTTSPTTSPKLCYDNLIVGSLGTYNPGTINANTKVMQTYPVSGLELGDFVQVSFGQDLQGIILYGYVSAVNQVTVVFQNSTYSNITLTSGTVRIHVTGHSSL